MLDVSQAGAPAGWQELQCLKMQRCACGLLYADAPIGCSVRMRLWAPLCGCAYRLLFADAPIGCSVRVQRTVSADSPAQFGLGECVIQRACWSLPRCSWNMVCLGCAWVGPSGVCGPLRMVCLKCLWAPAQIQWPCCVSAPDCVCRLRWPCSIARMTRWRR